MDCSAWRVELRRHIGWMNHDTFGLLPYEHPQKLVILHKPNPQPGERAAVQVGYLSDIEGTDVVFLPHAVSDDGGLPKPLLEHVNTEARRMRLDADFTDQPESK